MRARPPSATCSTEAPCEAFTADWRSTVTSASRRVPMARPAASSDAFTMREPEASFATELPDIIALAFRNRSADLAAVFVVTVGIGQLLPSPAGQRPEARTPAGKEWRTARRQGYHSKACLVQAPEKRN